MTERGYAGQSLLVWLCSISLVCLSSVIEPVKARAWSPHRDQQRTDGGRTGNASWYGGQFAGRRTASGERFDPYQLTAAHRTLPLGTKVLVQNPRTGRSCTVLINDRGPWVRGRQLDLSLAAAQRLGLHGVEPVVYYPIRPAYGPAPRQLAVGPDSAIAFDGKSQPVYQRARHSSGFHHHLGGLRSKVGRFFQRLKGIFL